MTFAINTIKDAFYDWVSSVSNKTVIWQFENAPAPALPYIGLNISQLASIGVDYETVPDNNGNAAIYGNRQLILEINYYGSGSLDTMEALATSLRSDAVLRTLNASGVCYVNKMLQTNTTVLIDSRYEERTLMELVFRYSNQGITDPDLIDVGLISYVESEGTLTDVDGTEIVKDVNVGTPYTPP